jgi:magnesium chelatase subunit D
MDGRGENLNRNELIPPAIEVGLKREATSTQGDTARRTRSTKSSSRRRAGARKTVLAERGRYSGASRERGAGRGVALDATLRAAASARLSGAVSPALKMASASHALNITAEDLRFKRLRGKTGALHIFLIDASGSMAANRIEQAKGALAQLLRRSYVNRDRVSLVSFRGRGAELLLAPTGSAARARAALDALPVGGATPLAAGLLRALEVARAASSESRRQINLVVFTDGRANVPLCENGAADAAALKIQIRDEVGQLCARLRKTCAGSLVVDTRSRFTSNGEGRFLADALGGRYSRLPQLISERAFAEALTEAEA